MSAPLLGPVAAALGRMIRRGLLIAGGALLALGARAETLEVSVSGAKGAPVADAVFAAMQTAGMLEGA